MNIRRFVFFACLAALPCVMVGQGLTQDVLLKQPTDAWPTYNGDYSGRRFSPLTQINSSNVHTLSLAWATRFSAGGGGRGGGGAAPAGGGAVQIKSTPLMVNGILYFSSPNNVWAADARTGRELWHYQYPANTGSTIGNRGVGMYGNWLFFETPDSNLVSVDASTGKERWKVRIADPKLDYTSTVAPVVVGNHILVGIGGDHLDNPGFLESRDPETGALQWKWWTTPRKGEPGIETWPDEHAAAHGTGMAWIPGTYDPELNLYIVGTGNPNPVMAEKSRKGDNLYTCSIVAINPDTGKMVVVLPTFAARYSRLGCGRDAGDLRRNDRREAAQAGGAGQPQRLLLCARSCDRQADCDHADARFVELGEGTRCEGPADSGSREIPHDGWSAGFAGYGRGHQLAVAEFRSGHRSVLRRHDEDLQHVLPDRHGRPSGGMGWAGYQRGQLMATRCWRSTIGPARSRGGTIGPAAAGVTHMLTTAGKLLFTSNGSNLIAFHPATGKILWHAGLMANPSAGPITYSLDGKQYVLVAAGDGLYAFTVNQPANETVRSSGVLACTLRGALV